MTPSQFAVSQSAQGRSEITDVVHR
jgi:hypothetical protein